MVKSGEPERAYREREVVDAWRRADIVVGVTEKVREGQGPERMGWNGLKLVRAQAVRSDDAVVQGNF